MANSKLKLYYFDGKGRAEVPRLLCVAAGKEFEDIRFGMEEWPQYQPKAPFGKAPFLEMEGKIYAQSVAISAFLARELGFYGKTNLECLKIDQIVQLYEDIVGVCQLLWEIQDASEKEAKVKEFVNESSPKYLAYFDRLLKENGTGYCVGNSPTLADFFLFDFFTGFMKDFLKEDAITPSLKKHSDTMLALPNIAPYIASRKPSDF